jgi:hypothetical protein
MNDRINRAVTPAALAIVLSLAAPCTGQSNGLPGSGLSGLGGGGLGSGSFGMGLGGGTSQARLESAEAALKSAEANLERIKQLVKSGVSTPLDLANAEANLAAARAALQATKDDIQRYEQTQALQRPVDIDLRDATLRQAAQVLSQATGMGIGIAEDVPQDLRFSVQARRVPLASVLDGLARQGNLMIAPGKDVRSIELRTWPALELNGQRQLFAGPWAPWANEWGGSVAMGGRAPFGERRAAAAAPVPADLHLTGVGERLVVASEAGKGPKGEPGFWLTVYRIDGTTLKKVGTTFHRSNVASPAAIPGLPGRTGTAPGGASPGKGP